MKWKHWIEAGKWKRYPEILASEVEAEDENDGGDEDFDGMETSEEEGDRGIWFSHSEGMDSTMSQSEENEHIRNSLAQI